MQTSSITAGNSRRSRLQYCWIDLRVRVLPSLFPTYPLSNTSCRPESHKPRNIPYTKVVLDKHKDPMGHGAFWCCARPRLRRGGCPGRHGWSGVRRTAETHAKPSLFAYPSPTKSPKKETVTKVAMAVLSTTVKINAREQKAAAKGDFMDPVSMALSTRTIADYE